MTSQFHVIDRRILTPSDIESLQRVFDEEIKARRITHDCPEAAILAARLIELHQRGVRNKASLREMLNPAA
ncbi:hypothetical protein GOE04_31730 [Sinorhizobium medicae]|nr:hypothetical protein [Sinorhizobium medicae]MDX0925820.1 hypothetical protein [Sinorhizobium medicae]MDX0937906.1 hypothetical protein [Sinorhizobium medicae]MDX0944004.1 hypothetical protein [Sinorhizobium medicae]MDX1029532.1 hypothetical protein [Sinorhizobium medicae]